MNTRLKELDKKCGGVFKLASDVSTAVGTLESLKYQKKQPTPEQVTVSVDAKTKLQEAVIKMSPKDILDIGEYVQRMAFLQAQVPEGNRVVWNSRVSASIVNRLVSVREALVTKTLDEAKQDRRWKLCTGQIALVRSFIKLAEATGYEPRHGMGPRAVCEVLEKADARLKSLAAATSLEDADKRMMMWESAKKLRSLAPKHWLEKPDLKRYQGKSGSFELGETLKPIEQPFKAGR